MQVESGSRAGVAREATTRGFRDLRVWQSAMTLAQSVYLVTRDFPRGEVYGLTSQLRRAAVSVPSNIAEGQARGHLREYLHHLSMAQGSVAELETQIELSERLGYFTNGRGVALMREAAATARQLRALRVALEDRLGRVMRFGERPSADDDSAAVPPKPETRNPKPRT